MLNHKHCKKCKDVLEKPFDRFDGSLVDALKSLQDTEKKLYYDLEVCKKCIIKLGIERLLKLNKKQPSAKGKPTLIKSGE